jgi:hypothetical protein
MKTNEIWTDFTGFQMVSLYSQVVSISEMLSSCLKSLSMATKWQVDACSHCVKVRFLVGFFEAPFLPYLQAH